MAHTVWGAQAAQPGGNNAAAGATGAFSGELAAQYIINNYYGGKTDNLSEHERQQISMMATIASGIAGGLAGNSTAAAGTGAQAGKNAVENNYLSSPDKSRQTYLNNKQNLKPAEQQERDQLNRKDAETTAGLVTACFGGDDKACSAARQDALEKQVTYQSLGYQNQKETQAGYQQIQQLLNGTSEEAKQTQALYNGMVAAYARSGMSEDAAKSAVGYQLGAMYIAGGIAGTDAGKAADEGLASSAVKPGTGPPSIVKEISITIEPKIATQMGKRGWTESSIQSVIENPVRTVVTKDTRFDSVSGSRLNDPVNFRGALDELINAEMSDCFYARTPWCDNRGTITPLKPFNCMASVCPLVVAYACL